MKPKNHPDLSRVLEAIGNSVKEIATHIHTVDLGKVGTVNAFGEEQLALDMLSNKIVQDHLTRTGLVALMASEEMEQEVRLPEGRFSVVFDPLDGSSLVDVN
ncbi:MAG: fructose-bisphosphatase class I, partial [Candidatus Gracilibacteria bacterium]